jgi:two-component system, NarL family, response regulator LiaR
VDGIELLRFVRRRHPFIHAIVLTNMMEAGAIHEALHEGATGYLLKTISVEELIQAIRAAHHGVPTLSHEVTQLLIQQTLSPAELMHHLTPREQEVLRLMARGWNNQQIASTLNITLSTVQFHVSKILAKLDVHNRTEAATFALRHQFGASSTWLQD